MVVDAKTKGEIEKQAKLYNAAKERAKKNIRDNIESVINKLRTTESLLLEEVDAEFGDNPFEKLLTEIGSGNHPADEEVRNTLEKGIPKDFGPVKSRSSRSARKSSHSKSGERRRWKRLVSPRLPT